jgi:hypothetical protein
MGDDSEQTNDTSTADADTTVQAGASTEKPAKKSKIGIFGMAITAIITGIAGFIFGIGSNQVTDFTKRADDCLDSLSLYLVGVESDVTDLHYVNLLPFTEGLNQAPPNQAPPQPTPPEQINAALLKFNTDIVSPRFKVLNKCPTRGKSTEYLNSNDINSWNDNFNKSRQYCFAARECSDATASSDLVDLANSTHTLINEANGVSQWGLFRRVEYEVTHLY